MSPLSLVLVVLSVVSVVLVLVVAVVLAIRQQALNKFTTVRNQLDEFTKNFEPGDLVYGPQRYHLGRAKMMLQTAEFRYAQAVKSLRDDLLFWRALNEFWMTESKLEDARREVRAASGAL